MLYKWMKVVIKFLISELSSSKKLTLYSSLVLNCSQTGQDEMNGNCRTQITPKKR